jgi:hypothetical protein
MATDKDGFSDTVVELRGNVPRRIVDVLDAVAQATEGKKSRIDVAAEVLGTWADSKIREAQAIERVLRGRP